MVTKEEIVVMTELLGISVKVANQLNRDFWYHGTTMEDALNIQETGVIANYNLGTQLDFGTGFYLTDTEDKASSYMSRLPYVDESGEAVSRDKWAVIEFEFNPCEFLLSKGGAVNFHTFPKHDEEFAKFVFFNRLNNSFNDRPHGYEIIWGVMSDSNPIEIISDYQQGLIDEQAAIEKLQKPNSMKQLYIGTQDICSMLKVHKIIEKSKED